MKVSYHFHEIVVIGCARSRHWLHRFDMSQCMYLLVDKLGVISNADAVLSNWPLTFRGEYFYLFILEEIAWYIRITISLNVVHKGSIYHDDVIKWKHFPRNWSFVRGIHRYVTMYFCIYINEEYSALV